VAPRIVRESQAASEKSISFEEPAHVSDFRNLAIDQRVASLINDNPTVVERYRGLAVKLLNLAERRKLKTLLVTSAEAGEGKTMVSTVIAWFLAKHPERRVLLIDGNSSMPAVGRTLGLATESGWLNLAGGSSDAKDAVIRIDPNGLCVMTPGTKPELGAPDATASSLVNVIAMLSPQFDLILVDAAAILESPDTQRLAAIMDGTMIVARAGHTHHSKVTAARKLVPKERRLGVVLNEADGGAEPANRKRRKSSFMGKLFGTKK
jgi:Mrp family chromosome partitioning ATPase